MKQDSESLDPRVNRLNPWQYQGPYQDTGQLDQWQTFEVFAQKQRGQHAIHLGSLHAPNAEMALVLAKEQYTRREKVHSLWLVRTADIFVTQPEDEELFNPGFDKAYRESFGYKNREVIETFKRQQSTNSVEAHHPPTIPQGSEPAKVVKRPVVIVGKK
jgi:ring-1,2-phenylacetyl-CoA epoxidase subunit PaaB